MGPLRKKATALCIHCSSPVLDAAADFCCFGCETVYNILQDRGWDDYYRFRDMDRAQLPPVNVIEEDFEFLDSDAYRERYVTQKNDLAETTWFMDGVSCSACLWLIDKVCRSHDGIQDAGVRLDDGRLLLVFTPQTNLRELAKDLAKLGYKANLTADAGEIGKGDLVRLGVSGALAGNLMMFGLPFYVGLSDGLYAAMFGGLQWILALVLLIYGAKPFYARALASARLRIFDLDQPIAIGLTMAFGVSSWHLFAGHFHQIYFDSIGMLVFFLLLGRYIQKRGVQRALAVTTRLISDMPQIVDVIRDGKSLRLPAQHIGIGDLIHLRVGEVVPVDGQLISPKALVNLHVVTGESEPVAHSSGETVPAGAINQGCAIDLVAVSSLATSGVSRLHDQSLQLNENKERGDKLAGRFLAVVLLSALAGLLIWLPAGLDRALTISATVFIVACPCALALARPTARALALDKAGKAGIWIKSLEVFDKLPMVREIIFDKTGVLTFGSPQIIESRVLVENKRQLESAVAYLEREMRHPLAKAFEAEFSPRLEPRTVGDVEVRAGLGVCGTLDGRHVIVTGVKGLEHYDLADAEIARAKTERAAMAAQSGSHVMVFVDGALAAIYALEDNLRPEIKSMLEHMGRRGLRRAMLSGDTDACVNRISQGLALDQVHGQMLPQDKLNYIKQSDSYPAMVGDGLNDMGALAAAHVGFTHSAATQAALEFADVVFQGQSMDRLETTFQLVGNTQRAANIGIRVSLIYNSAAIVLTLAGFIGPLAAAILMALSSISVPGVIALCFHRGGRA